jgi:hypothetical protein
MKDYEYIVTTRKCEHCNHHEVGIIDKDRNYTQLKPGTKIKIIEEEKTKG